MAADAQKSLQHRSPFLRQPSFADSTWPENGVLRLVGTAFRFKLAPVTNGWTSLLPETPGVSARLTSLLVSWLHYGAPPVLQRCI